jgi:amidase
VLCCNIVAASPVASAISDPQHQSGSLDVQGVEAFPYAFTQYVKQGFGFENYADFVDYVGVSPLAPGEVLGGEVDTFPPGAERDVIAAGVANPDAPPNLQPFEDYKAQWLGIFDSVFEDNDLDALVFPQAQELLPEYFGPKNINATTVGEINVLGVPAVIVPSTRVTTATGAPSPFALIFIGQAFDEAKLLAQAYEYEQATQLRWVPELRSSIPVPDMATE